MNDDLDEFGLLATAKSTRRVTVFEQVFFRGKTCGKALLGKRLREAINYVSSINAQFQSACADAYLCDEWNRILGRVARNNQAVGDVEVYEYIVAEEIHHITKEKADRFLKAYSEMKT